MLRLQMTRLLLYNADKDLFGRQHIAANIQQINWRKLCVMSCPQFHAHSHTKMAAFDKTHKSILLTTTEKEVKVVQHEVTYHFLAIF